MNLAYKVAFSGSQKVDFYCFESSKLLTQLANYQTSRTTPIQLIIKRSTALLACFHLFLFPVFPFAFFIICFHLFRFGGTRPVLPVQRRFLLCILCSAYADGLLSNWRVVYKIVERIAHDPVNLAWENLLRFRKSESSKEASCESKKEPPYEMISLKSAGIRWFNRFGCKAGF